MTNDVKALIEAVEREDFSRISAHQIKQALGGHYGPWLMAACRGDLNAAKALHEALLPGWMPDMQMLTDGNWLVQMWSPDGGPCVISVENAIFARAWLLSILRAHAQEAEL